MPSSKLVSFGCLTTVMVVLAVPGVAADWPTVSPSDKDVYLTSPPLPPRPKVGQPSIAQAKSMSEINDLREFIMKFIQDERICTDPTLRDLILGEDGSDERAKVWWTRRCGGRRGGAPRLSPSQSSESTLIRYRRKSSNRDNPQNSLDRSPSEMKKWKKIQKIMKDVACKPKKKAVPIPNADTTLLPKCVYIKQCGGCCESPQLECVPTRTKNRTFPTMDLTPKRNSFGFSSNPIRMVKVEEHKACKCQCKVRAEHCTPSQVYVEDACECQCPQVQSCPSKKKLWNMKTCRCECRKSRECPTGRYFDVNTCRCLRP